MSGALDVPVGELLAHGATLEQVARSVETVHAAARQVHLDLGSYGQLCQFMPTYFEPGTQATVDGLASSVTELRKLSAALTTAAHGYAGTDTAASRRLGPASGVELAL